MNDMSLQNILQSIMERLQGSASVKMVFGEPIDTKEKTIIPVAKVAYGFGAGSGGNKKMESKESMGGGGGGVCGELRYGGFMRRECGAAGAAGGVGAGEGRGGAGVPSKRLREDDRGAEAGLRDRDQQGLDPRRVYLPGDGAGL